MSPSHQERVFKQSYALELLSIAEADWSTALYLRKGLQEHAVRSENFFFFVQQTLEKLLKAVLVSQQLPVPLVYRWFMIWEFSSQKFPGKSSPRSDMRSTDCQSLRQSAVMKKVHSSGMRKKLTRPLNLGKNSTDFLL